MGRGLFLLILEPAEAEIINASPRVGPLSLSSSDTRQITVCKQTLYFSWNKAFSPQILQTFTSIVLFSSEVYQMA